MNSFHHVASLREALDAARSEGKTIGFVPTMGNLHDAHLALVKQAQEESDIVVVSIFVNRLQFGLNEDWDKYPRTLDADSDKLRSIGCDFLFCPEEQAIYPNGMDEQTRVIVPTMANILCGASRPGHFEGVTTVVTKLFNIVQPNIAVFGIKDYQQLAIIRRMVEDLCLPIKILAGNIVREDDGLAMSSRNKFIEDDERTQANKLFRALSEAADKIRGGDRDFVEIERHAKEQIQAAGFKPDYFSVRESKSLEPAAFDDSDITIVGAMYTRRARLIDNLSVN